MMQNNNTQDNAVYNVVINHEEQYSIWPEHREIPPGWSSVGVSGPKTECLGYIDTVWTDMRPLSLRKLMDQQKSSTAEMPIEEDHGQRKITESLPVRLSRELQPVELVLRPECTTDRLVSQIKTGCLHIRFTGTRGGTDLAVEIEPAAVELMVAQVTGGENTLRISGELTLDYVPVRCIADIDTTTFAGTGKLEILTQPNCPQSAL
jgi:uncharacterized protein YbdZ (MbtH family)